MQLIDVDGSDEEALFEIDEEDQVPLAESFLEKGVDPKTIAKF